MNNKNGVDWGSQISDLALNLASSKISNYATNTIQKFPFVLGASMNIDIRTEGTTNIGGDLLFKIADFGLKGDQTRDGLAFLHTKYTGSLSNDSTWNAGLGIRHLIGEDVLAADLLFVYLFFRFLLNLNRLGLLGTLSIHFVFTEAVPNHFLRFLGLLLNREFITLIVDVNTFTLKDGLE